MPPKKNQSKKKGVGGGGGALTKKQYQAKLQKEKEFAEEMAQSKADFASQASLRKGRPAVHQGPKKPHPMQQGVSNQQKRRQQGVLTDDCLVEMCESTVEGSMLVAVEKWALRRKATPSAKSAYVATTHGAYHMMDQFLGREPHNLGSNPLWMNGVAQINRQAEQQRQTAPQRKEAQVKATGTGGTNVTCACSQVAGGLPLYPAVCNECGVDKGCNQCSVDHCDGFFCGGLPINTYAFGDNGGCPFYQCNSCMTMEHCASCGQTFCQECNQMKPHPTFGFGKQCAACEVAAMYEASEAKNGVEGAKKLFDCLQNMASQMTDEDLAFLPQ